MGRVRTASVVLCFLMLFVIDVSFSLIKCLSYHWYLQPNGFAAPILLLRAPPYSPGWEALREELAGDAFSGFPAMGIFWKIGFWGT